MPVGVSERHAILDVKCPRDVGGGGRSAQLARESLATAEEVFRMPSMSPAPGRFQPGTVTLGYVH